jgi:type VI protein secretion system component Hcp
MRARGFTGRRSRQVAVSVFGLGALVGLLGVGLLWARAGQASAAPAAPGGRASIYAKLVDGAGNPIHGDVLVAPYAGQIQVDSTNLGVTITTTVGGGTGSGGGRPVPAPFSFMAPAGSDSPVLLHSLLTSDALRSATFTFVRPGVDGVQYVYQTYTFTTCIVSSFQQATQVPQDAEDTVQLRCEKWAYAFRPPNGPSTSWDFVTNSAG